MLEYLSFDETRYLAALVSGEYTPDFWNENARQRLAAKLTRLGHWAVKENEARERLRKA